MQEIIFETILKKSKSGSHYLELEPEWVAGFLRDNNRRVVCRINENEGMHCAVMSNKEGSFFIHVGASSLKKWQLRQGNKVTITLHADNTDYQFHMPEELQEVLTTDSEAENIFHGLTGGNQRGLMHPVNQVKSTDKKIERALKIAENLKRGISSPRNILK